MRMETIANMGLVTIRNLYAAELKYGIVIVNCNKEECRTQCATLCY